MDRHRRGVGCGCSSASNWKKKIGVQESLLSVTRIEVGLLEEHVLPFSISFHPQ